MKNGFKGIYSVIIAMLIMAPFFAGAAVSNVSYSCLPDSALLNSKLELTVSFTAPQAQ